eukprot:NODE_890_length_1111_cov_112.809793_g727_i0.p2 GENE.NODE_890_length_1111_cov_112.809793_g727_i0~~NODE_890_length_1111_cov_112.809793_g727_i0.p2  ORF type:complete len:285 (+),score=67.11 NODE_890_length_1111_cov_112.809793_g727_i0:32-856(+)
MGEVPLNRSFALRFDGIALSGTDRYTLVLSGSPCSSGQPVQVEMLLEGSSASLSPRGLWLPPGTQRAVCYTDGNGWVALRPGLSSAPVSQAVTFVSTLPPASPTAWAERIRNVMISRLGIPVDSFDVLVGHVEPLDGGGSSVTFSLAAPGDRAAALTALLGNVAARHSGPCASAAQCDQAADDLAIQRPKERSPNLLWSIALVAVLFCCCGAACAAVVAIVIFCWRSSSSASSGWELAQELDSVDHADGQSVHVPGAGHPEEDERLCVEDAAWQ